LSVVIHVSLKGKRFSEVVKHDDKGDEDAVKSVLQTYYEDQPPAYDDLYVSHI
jgi:hypothetical protein